MTVEEAVYARVSSLSPVTAIVGTRVYTDRLPQGETLPAVVVRLIDDVVPYHLRGPVGTNAARVQVDAIVREDSGVDAYGQASDLMAAIDGNGLGRNASGLAGFIGDIGSPGFQFLGVFPESRRRDYDPDELRQMTMSRDYIVHFRL